MSPVSAARLTVPRGNPPAAPYELPGFSACSLYVANPSGVWYDIEGFTVEPWTWGLILRLDVPTPTITVRQRTPTGLVSEDFGEDMLLIAYPDALMPSVGRTLSPTPRNERRISAAQIATEVPVIYYLGIANAADRVVPLDVQFGAHDSVFLRAMVTCTWSYALTPGGARLIFARQAATPESPNAPPLDLSWVTTILPNCDVYATIVAQDGAGAMGVYATLVYYRALP